MILTIIIIVIILFWALKEDIKDEKKRQETPDPINHEDRKKQLANISNFRHKSHDVSGLERVFTGIVRDSNILDIFTYSDRCVFVKYKDGSNFTKNLDDMDVLFRYYPSEYGNGSRRAEILINGSRKCIQEHSGLAMAQWNEIFNILSLAATTHDVQCLSEENRKLANQACRIQKQNQRMMQQQRRTWNMINRRYY